VGIFSLLNLEFTMPIVAALLTIIGYSLNDTIVVFDRSGKTAGRTSGANCGGSSKKHHPDPEPHAPHGGTTLLVVLALFFLGGAVIRDFAFALIIGIVVGTYSSIFIASSIVLAWEQARPAKEKKKR
jgi:preprotein translocase subunit SecF